jgi:hypothetical protein
MSSGNTLPTPPVSTIPQLNVSTLPFTIAGYVVEVNNVTITPAGNGTFGNGATGSSANQSLTITDSSGNSMVLYYWPSSYSVDAQMYGQTIPTGPVNIIGFDSVYSATSTAEFTPLAIVVPGPSVTTLLGLGALALFLRSKKSAWAAKAASPQTVLCTPGRRKIWNGPVLQARDRAVVIHPSATMPCSVNFFFWKELRSRPGGAPKHPARSRSRSCVGPPAGYAPER